MEHPKIFYLQKFYEFYSMYVQYQGTCMYVFVFVGYVDMGIRFVSLSLWLSVQYINYPCKSML